MGRLDAYELRTDAWASIRSADGILIATTQRPGLGASVTSTQMDAAEAVAQMKAAHALSKTLCDAATHQTALNSKTAQTAQHDLINAIDPAQQGKYTAPVNSQTAQKTQPGTRDLDPTTPVEKFATPAILLDSPTNINWDTPASTALFAGQHLHWTSQADLHLAAAHTLASVAGGATTLFTHSGGIQAIAANGPLSLQAHTDQLEILADDSVTVTSVNGDIEIKASQKIVLQAGQSSITLEGANITLACPGSVSVKGAVHGFEGAMREEAGLEGLPVGVVGAADNELATFLEEKTWVEFQLVDSTNQPLPFEKYVLQLPDGRKTTGQLDATGGVRIEAVKRGECIISFPSHNLTLRT
ncbi:MAG: type VI secretion system tip protein VgrG [Gammaproteobacteria bacterium]